MIQPVLDEFGNTMADQVNMPERTVWSCMSCSGLDRVRENQQPEVCGLLPCDVYQVRQDRGHHRDLRPHQQAGEGRPDDGGALHPLHLQGGRLRGVPWNGSQVQDALQ